MTATATLLQFFAKAQLRESPAPGGKAVFRKAEQLLLFQPRQPVQHPGERGGKGYYTERAEWRYGARPTPEPPPRRVDLSGAPMPLPSLNDLYQMFREAGWDAAKARPLVRQRFPGAMDHYEGARRWRAAVAQWAKPGPTELEEAEARLAAKVAAPEPAEQRERHEDIDGVPTIIRTGSPGDPFKYQSWFHVTMAYDAEGYPAESRKLHAATLEEYRALLASRQPKPPEPEPEPPAPVGNPKAAAKLRASADALQAQIDALSDPAIGHQNITARRSRIAGGMAARGMQLERTQRILRNLAAQHEAGTVPPVLAGVRTKPHVDAIGTRDDSVGKRIYPVPSVSRADLADAYTAARHHVAFTHTMVPDAETIEAALADAPMDDPTTRQVPASPALMAALGRLVAYDQQHPRFNQYGHREGRIRYSLDWPLRMERQRKQLVAAGITPETFAEAKAALAALDTPPPPDPRAQVKAAERELLGRKIPGYFPTPRAAAEAATRAAEIGPGMRVLEPSAGKGDMAEAIRDLHPDAQVTAVELVHDLADIARLRGVETRTGDIMSLTADDLGGPFDRVVMNPPFEHGAEIDHVRHAFHLLKPGGVLVSIMSEGPFFRGDSHATGFRDWLAREGAHAVAMPEGSFMRHETSDRTTGVRTRMVTIHKRAGEGLLAKARRVLARWAFPQTKEDPGRNLPAPSLSPEETLARWQAREGELVKALWYLDHEDIPAAVPDSAEAGQFLKARAAAAGELRALQGVLVKARKMHFRRSVGGLDVSVENRKGTLRQWHDAATGTDGQTKMPASYGYLRGTLGLDGDHVDVFLGPLAHDGRVEATDVYVILTARPPFFDTVDEQKVMLGYPSWADARRTFLAAYQGDPRFLASVDVLPFADFKQQALATRRAGAERIKGAPIAKGHVGAYQRTTKTGQAVQVGAYENARTAQQKAPGPGRPPAAAPPAPMGRAPAAAPAPTGARMPGLPAHMPAAPAPAAAAPTQPAKPHDLHELAAHIKEFHPAATEATERLSALFPGQSVLGRLKEPHKLDEKLRGTSGTGKAPKQLHEIEDIAGTRVTFDKLDDIHAAVDRIKRNFNIRGEDDYLSRPKANYRSYHLVLEVQGKPVELQLRTERQTRWADFAHDTVYKQQAGEPLPPEIHDYLAQMAHHYECLDGGRESECGAAPECPPVVLQQYGCLDPS